MSDSPIDTFQETVVEAEAVAVPDPGNVADEIAGVQKEAALSENLAQAAEEARDQGPESIVAKLDRIESKLDELLARGS